MIHAKKILKQGTRYSLDLRCPRDYKVILNILNTWHFSFFDIRFFFLDLHHYGFNAKLCWDKIGHHFCGLENPYLGKDWCWTNEKKTEWDYCYRTCMIIFIQHEKESAVKNLQTLTYLALCNWGLFESVKPILKMLVVS